MNVSLTPELEAWVEARVRSVLYGSSSEVVRAALRLLHQFEEAQGRKLTDLREALELGVSDATAGRVMALDEGLAESVKRLSRLRRGP